MEKTRILLLGGTGQIGGDLRPLLDQFQVHTPDRRQLDLSRPESIRECVRSFAPQMILNAAAYTAVDRAESEVDLAAAINTVAPAVLAEEAKRTEASLVHYSTDYVFDGTKSSPYVETDPLCPLNVYGKTKADGEEAIRATDCDHVILRTSWVFGPRGSNFLRTILKLAAERNELRIVDDQIGAPTSSESVARATVELIGQWLRAGRRFEQRSGTYHLTASGYTSWFGFANAIVRRHGGLCVKKIVPIPSREYPTPARRPLNSRMDCLKIRDAFGISMPEWEEALASALRALKGPGHLNISSAPA
jgi:dTDP-4-dehydrorhamnose reductase